MAGQCKGTTYVQSIGRTNAFALQNSEVSKAVHSEDLRTFWGRLCSAWQARYRTQATQTAIAVKYGIKQPSVGDYMRGALPRMAKAVEIASDLRVNVEWLLTGRGARSPLANAPDPFYSMIFQMMEQLPESERVRIAEQVRFKLEHVGVFPKTMEEAVERMSETGKHRKPQ